MNKKIMTLFAVLIIVLVPTYTLMCSEATSTDLENPEQYFKWSKGQDVREEPCAIAEEFLIKTSESKIKLTIPSEVTLKSGETLPVRIIGKDCFKDCYFLEEVTLPSKSGSYKGLEKIDERAFEGCTSLTSIDIPECVITINNYAFKGCSSLVELNLHHDYEELGLGNHLIDGCKIKTMFIPDNAIITNASEPVFNGCESLASFECDSSGVNYTIDKNGALIYLMGDAPTLIEYPCDRTGSEYVVDNSIGIINCAFYNSKLTSITLNDNITSISESAFANCKSLKEIKGISNDDYKIGTSGELIKQTATEKTLIAVPMAKTFDQGTYSVPSEVNKIGNYAFYNCKNLTKIVFHNSVLCNNADSFNNCANLESFEVTDPQETGIQAINNGSVLAIKDANGYSVIKLAPAYKGECVLTSDVKFISVDTGKTFKDCKYLTKFEWECNSLVIIGTELFSGCSELTEVKISGTGTIDSLPNGVFDGCEKLKTITWNLSQDGMGLQSYVFRNCKSLEHLELPENTSSRFNESIFEGCASLIDFNICTGITVGVNMFKGCSKLTTVTFSNNYAKDTINRGAFEECSALTNITLPNTIKTIDKQAFKGCTSLTNFTIPDSVETIGYHAFEGCTSITGFNITSKVSEIGVGAFKGCSNLEAFSVDPGNKTFAAEKGVLFRTDATNGLDTLIQYPGGNTAESYTIPNGIKTIEMEAFAGCKVKELTIPKNIEEFCNDCFGDMRFFEPTGAEITDMTELGGFTYKMNSDGQMVKVTSSRPTLTITSPGSGTTKEKTFDVSGTTTNATKVTITNNGVSIGTVELIDGTFNATVKLSEGKNVIAITVSDLAENTKTETIEVTYVVDPVTPTPSSTDDINYAYLIILIVVILAILGIAMSSRD